MAATKTPQIYKVVLIGNSGVGKSNLLSRLNTNEFSDEFLSTIGVEFLTKVLEVDGVRVKAQVWDTAGQERYNSMMSTYYRNAKGALIVYDISDPKSFEAAERWRKDLVDQANVDGLVLMLVGNKCDLDGEGKRKVTHAQAQQYAISTDAAVTKTPMLFEEASAKSGHNVQKVFIDLLTAVHRQRQQRPRGDTLMAPSENTITLEHQAMSAAQQRQAGGKPKSTPCC